MRSSLQPLLRSSLVALALASFASVAQSPVDVRVALVIGNAAYRVIPPLSNSGNDAKSMGVVLRKLGFKVLDVIDGDRAAMVQAITRMQAELKGQQAAAMLYYAGHGLQLDWHNYMVPVDATIVKAADVPAQTVDIELVLKAFSQAATRINIVVLDACRDNPFAGSTGSKGLAQLDAPPGTYLAFATAPGNVAEDGDAASGNGLFTQYLLKELQRPARIEDVFKRVRLQVRQQSQGRQIPWDSSSLEDDFAFNDGRKFSLTPDDFQKEVRLAKDREEQLRREAEGAAERERQLAALREQERLKLAEAQRLAEQQGRERAQAEAKERERQLALAIEEERKKVLAAQQALERARAQEAQRLKDIEQAKAQAEEEARRKRLSAEAARERQFAEEKAEWDKIKNSKKPEDFYAFLLRFPSGLIAEQATFALEALDKAKITAQPDRNGQVQRLGEPRFRLGDRYVVVRRDDYTGNVIQRSTITVDKIDNGLVYSKADTGETHIRTVDGGAVRLAFSDNALEYDPPRLDLPGGELSVGKKWSGATLQSDNFNKNLQRTDDFKIVAFEEVTIKAGTFKAYKIEMKGWAGRGRVDVASWYLPDWGVPLKSLRRVYMPKGAPIKESFELESFTRGPVDAAQRSVAERVASAR